MAAGCKHKDIVRLFELRFDYQSARIMTSEALRQAGLEAASTYEAQDISAIAGALARLSPDATRVVEALAALAAPAEKPPAEKPPAEKPPAEKPTAEKPPAEKPAKAKAKAKAVKKKAAPKKTSKK